MSFAMSLAEYSVEITVTYEEPSAAGTPAGAVMVILQEIRP